MARGVRSNRDMFALKGNPWEVDIPARQPVLGPDGNLRLSRRAHIIELLSPSSLSVPHGDQGEQTTEDDLFVAGHCLPLSIRLKKERNELLASMNAGKSSASLSRGKRALIAGRARVNKVKASHLVKVK